MTNKEVKALMVDTDKLDIPLKDKLELKQKQWDVAMEDGNVQMLIWLGKQYLGQSDKPSDIKEDELPSGFDLKVI
jgi:hypothetical protein|tara:strand:- start:95 stop:319 length:225 start_codon:yes stop_codon:yes gene_type:complete